MPLGMALILLVALIGLLALSARKFTETRNLRVLLAHVALIAVVGVAIYSIFGLQSNPLARGPESNDLPMIGALFGCMLVGMLAHWLYWWLETPKDQRTAFDLAAFVAPVFASPIVFIPLLASLQNANLDLRRVDTARFMLFLVAFENGFFWKEYFDNRKRRAEK